MISRGLRKSQLAHFRLEILTNSAIFHFFGQPPSSIWQRPKKSSDSVTVISDDFHPPWLFRQSISPIATRPIRAWEIDSGSSQRLGLAVRDSEIRNIAQKLFPALHDRHFQHTLHATHTQQNQQQNGLHCLHFHRLRRGPQGVQGPGAYSARDMRDAPNPARFRGNNPAPWKLGEKRGWDDARSTAGKTRAS